jgi:D-alanyl-D-alanine carboxypeptidase
MIGLGRVGERDRKVLAIAGVAGLTASILISLSSPAEAARKRSAPKGGGYNPPYAAMVLDVRSGKVLHAENPDALRHPASVTKVMTLYMLFEQLERGKLNLNSELQVSANAARQAPSKLYLKPGETIEVEDAIKALVTKSANDVAAVVAENLAGSEEEFAEQMTRKARSLGMSRTVFRNASGLPDPEQVTTARDLTILAQAIQERFPKYYRYFQTSVFHYAGASHRNHNKLLGKVEGVDGIKTGFTQASGFNLMTNARTEDRHIVAVVLGGKSGPSRDRIMASLVRSSLPRAYAGGRTTAPVVTAEAPAPRRVESRDVEATAATSASATPPARRPLDPTGIRPVVASASGASSTTTPSSNPFRLAAQSPLPLNAQAYAALQEPAAAPAVSMARVGKLEDRLPAVNPVAPVVAKTAPRLEATPEIKVEAKVETKAAAPEAKRDTPRTAPTGWVIQLGAMDDQDKAKDMLDRAKARMGRALQGASPFTEKLSKDGSTLYRARFSGFDEAKEAQDACKALKRSGFSCFATRS